MFRAVCTGVRRDDAGTITAKVRFERDDVTPPKPLYEDSFSGKSQLEIKSQLDAVLAKLKSAETDVALNQQFVGVTLSSI